ncbi:MAG: glycosyltransferase family 4 protein [Gammaproteobacteria bacterium]|nr:glycosyltransferase family 4 protein [Gammaproteobacteria bacterium]
MKIVMVNDNDPDAVVGGTEHYIADLTQALETDGHEVYWFVLGDDSSADIGGSATRPGSLKGSAYRRRPGKHVFRPGQANRSVSIIRRAVFYPALNRELGAYVARVRPDVVHLHNNYRYPFTILAATRGCRVVQTVHDYCAIYPTAYCSRQDSCAGRSVFAALRHGCLTWKLLATEACLLYGRRFLDRRFVDAFIAPSRDLATHLERMGHTRVAHVPNLRLLAHAEPTPAPKGQVVLYVGGLVEHKGVAMLLAAFARVVSEAPQASLWLVGDGLAIDDLKASAAGLCQVRFLGWRSPEELARIYRQARAVVIPSLWMENAPLVAIEASAPGGAGGQPRGGGGPELVDDGRTGFLFDRGDSDGLAERLHLLLTNQALAGKLGAAGHERLGELRSPAKHLERLMAVYDKARR